MAVLIEGISVVLRVASLEEMYPGGPHQFVEDSPNRTVCGDADLIRVGYMSPTETKTFVEKISEFGLVYNEGGKARDLVVIDQQRGFAIQCDWAEFGRVDWKGDQTKKVSACWMLDSKDNQVWTPDGWQYENSLSSKFTFIESGRVPEYLDFLRNENGIDVYQDLRTGKEVYAPRAP